MSSGAGDADARRRRDLPYLFNFHYLFLSFWFLLSFCICVHLSKNPNFPSLLTFFSQKPEQYSIDISHGSRSELTTVPPTAPPHWFSLMARVNLGPSDAPFPVGTSTAHGEIQIWQVALLVASSPSITTSELQSDGGGETSSAVSFLGFCWMGFTSNYGPITILWPMQEKCLEAHTLSIFQALYTFADPSPALPKSRFALLNASLSRPLKICCSLKDGRRLHSTVATIVLDGTCNFNSLNLMDRVTWLPSDAILISKLFGLRLLSNHWWCDINHASALVCEHRSSINILNIKLSHPAPRLLGASQQSRTFWKQSRTFWKKRSRYVRPNLFSSSLKPDYHCFDLKERGRHASLALSFAFWLCEFPWRIRQIYSYKEIPFSQPYSDIGEITLLEASPMEQFTKSSYASFARAVYDHKLIGDSSKFIFNLEFLKVSKDLPTFAKFLKLCMLENSLSLYLYLSRFDVILICMNSPLLRI